MLTKLIPSTWQSLLRFFSLLSHLFFHCCSIMAALSRFLYCFALFMDFLKNGILRILSNNNA